MPVLTLLNSCHAGGEAVHACDAERNLGCMSDGVSGGNPLAKGFKTAHFRGDLASRLIAEPVLYVRLSEALGDASGWTVIPPETPSLAEEYDGDVSAI